jgi:signal transduction histidine kinase
MADGGTALARARSDGADRLLSADEPLAGLQRAAGGDLPGIIAMPAMLEVVRKTRRYGLRLARSIVLREASQAMTAWVEVAPREDGEEGCDIVLRSIQPLPQALAEPIVAEDLAATIDTELAELVARLDKDQNLLSAEAEADDLQAMAAAMRASPGRPWTDFVTVEGSAHHQPMHWRLLDGAIVRCNGSARAWRVRLTPQVVPGSAPVGFELALSSEEAPPLRPEPLELIGQSPVPGMIGRDIAPVLRLPIARIIANAETIRTRMAGPLADEYANYAQDIAAAGQHLLGLLDDLADLEVVEADDFSAAPDHIDLADVARRAAGILGVRARERGIIIDAPRAGESLPAVAEFRRVLQVLLNLLGNAIRYAPADSQVWVRLEEDVREGAPRVRVIVADQGPGLDAGQQEKVFEKFERLGRSGDGGSGLGLYISRRLARAMGGELSVESAPGQGARFILELPGDPAAQPAGRPDEAQGKGPAPLGEGPVLPRIPGLRQPD